MTLLVLLLGLPAVARAEDPAVTMQARAANAEFLGFAPPPEGGSGAVCLVDTGLDLNPDTEPTAVERLALDGGTPGDVRETKHGTSMAMTMGAPMNGWGGVGAWPHVRVVSIRAMPAGAAAFPFHYYSQAVELCRKRAGARHVKVVNLSLGGAGADQTEIARLRDHFLTARADGLNVVAAAGNGGGAVDYPAAIPEAFAIGGVDEQGLLCSFSARGEGLDLLAPGCGLDVGLPDGRPGKADGTSDSAAFTSAVLAALRSYRPDLGPAAAEDLLAFTARATPGGPLLDVEAAFRAAGLGQIVDAGHTNRPVDPSPAGGHDGGTGTGPGGQDPGPGSGRPRRGILAHQLPKPRLRFARLRRGDLVVRLRNRPRYAEVVATIVYGAGRGEFRRRERTLRRQSSTVRLRLPRRWSRLSLEYRDFELEPSHSLTLTRRSLATSRSNTRRDR